MKNSNCLSYLILVFNLPNVYGTIDINLPELQYIADHLDSEECVKLLSLLHVSSFVIPKVMEAAETTLNEEESCFKLLLHWNSSPGEGLGETHVKLAHRLRQIGRPDLSDWLSINVFEQLGISMNDTVLSNPFKYAETNHTSVVHISTEANISTTDSSWNYWTILNTLVLLILVVFIGMCFYYCYQILCTTVFWNRLYKKCKQRFCMVGNKAKDYIPLKDMGTDNENENN